MTATVAAPVSQSPWTIVEQNYRLLVRANAPRGHVTVADCGLADSAVAKANARLVAAAPDLYAALRNVAACFGKGPESDEFWESWADCTGCDCSDPNHPHDSDAVRALILAQAAVALERAVYA